MPRTNYQALYKEDWDEIRSKIQLAASNKKKWQNLIPLFELIFAQNAVFIMVWNIKINCIDATGMITYTKISGTV